MTQGPEESAIVVACQADLRPIFVIGPCQIASTNSHRFIIDMVRHLKKIHAALSFLLPREVYVKVLPYIYKQYTTNQKYGLAVAGVAFVYLTGFRVRAARGHVVIYLPTWLYELLPRSLFLLNWAICKSVYVSLIAH